jgi:protein tyrosine/serine phosphatase
MARPTIAPLSLALLLLLSGSTVPAAAADNAVADTSSIPRFARVADRLYRGGQPTAKDFAYLHSLGIRTVVSLREDDRGERAIVEKLGMKLVHIPVTFMPFAPSTKLPETAVKKFFEVLDDPSSGPVFVHCRRGADRTGAFIGLYRMVREQWGAQRAYEEARKIGMRWWYFDVKDQLAKVAKALGDAEASATKLVETDALAR